MGRRKLGELSIDDLMRIQEGPRRKRIRHAALEEHRSESEASGSEEGYEKYGESEHSSAEGEDEEEEYLAAKSGEDQVEEPEEPDILSRFSTSRVPIQPRKDLVISAKEQPFPQELPRSFEEFGISSALLTALHKMSIRSPTEVQAVCIPPLLQGRDCIGIAKTGSGKTIAFALPILQQLSYDPYGLYALVLTPTRELAFQISEQFAVLGSALNLRTAVVVGGMDMIAQAIELENRPHVVVATPGRIVDHLKSSGNEWNLSRIKFLVLDEADRLLTPTFAPELSYLFDVLPKERQTCLFTATLTPSIEALAAAPPRPGKEKPFIHRMTEKVETVETLTQSYILVPSHVRESYLYYLLRNPPESTLHLRRAPAEPTSYKAKQRQKQKQTKGNGKKASAEEEEIEQPPPTIVFCTKPRTAAYLTNLLKTLHIRSTALHSRLTQRERLNSLGLFRSSVIPVLVSTDVGGRGLDIEDVAMVINWDLPNEPEEYTHRVGRTARAGRGGIAVSFVTERDEEKVMKIEERIRTKLTGMNLPEAKVLESLNAVSTAKRLANMELHDSDFGRREEIHKIKSMKRRADVEAMS
ncbi:P-loop containing nucleoside triphosphate hydrolase protein [Cristinia sonorae]|uniref:P-loop containing nucleoside triphosphate hydrolase protein n=1 Tax=Cristinia sonorae TaxID=1940300 RepID=A0A8K0UW19_9AGAR|nr:P-loop containing nucleoside triphosphate hydrolase protein [Cristinia sonorae]